MKKLIILIFTFISLIYSSEDDKIQMSVQYSSQISELREVLRFEGIEYFKVSFTGNKIKGKNYYIVAKEIKNGTICNVDTIAGSKNDICKITEDNLEFIVIAKKINVNQLKIFFKLPRFGMEYKYDIDDINYSLRPIGENTNILVDSPFYAFAYIPPYTSSGYSSFCKITNSKIKAENWGTNFGLDYYILYEMKFE